MDSANETTPSRGFYASSRGGAGGKFKKPPSRKPPTTPYSRPPPKTKEPEQGKRRWLSSVVDPAYRLISGGATRLYSTLFSPASSANALPAPHGDEEEIEQNELDADLNNRVTSTETAGPSRVGNISNDGSGAQGRSVENDSNLAGETGLSEIEQLLKGKKFSRDEVNRLMEIIQSKSVEDPITRKGKEKLNDTAGGYAKEPVSTHAVPKASLGEIREDMSKSIWATSTPLPQSARREEIGASPSYTQRRGEIGASPIDMSKSIWATSTPLPQSARREEIGASPSYTQRRGEIGASPIELAKAYMGSRTSDIDDRASLHNNDVASTPFIPAHRSKPATFWPGSMAQNQRDYSTPQSERGRYGLHNFPRTPYSRTIFSKSKPKFSPLQGAGDKAQRTVSTPFKHVQTLIFEQPKGDALDAGNGRYGSSVGPIRRTRHQSVMQTPTRGSPYAHSSLIGTPHADNSLTHKDFLPAGKKFEFGGISDSSPFKSIDRQTSSSQVGVHPHTSQIARTILEHINRNSPTPKDNSEELKLATGWKKPQTSDISSLNRNGDDSSLLAGSSSSKIANNDNQKKPVLDIAEKWNSLFKPPPPKPTSKVADIISNGSFGDGNAGTSIAKSTEEAFPQTTKTAVDQEVLNQPKKVLFQPSGTATKRSFPAISVDKPESSWKLPSDKTSNFTFPVSTTSLVLSEPPTPSVMPTLPASPDGPVKDAYTAVPTYTFGSENSDRLVFAFPSTSDQMQTVASDIKFSFGSDKPRMSFKDAIS